MASRNPFGFAYLTALGLKRLRLDAGVTLVLGVTVFLTSFGITAAPRLISSASDDSLQLAAEQAAPIQRNVTFDTSSRINPEPGDPYAGVEDEGANLEASLGDELGSAIDETRYVVLSPGFDLTSVPVESREGPDRYFWFRHHEGIADHIVSVEGRLPEPATVVETVLYDCEALEIDPEDEVCGEIEIPLHETALTAETAEWLRVEVGDRVLMTPRVESGGNSGIPLALLNYELLLEVVGIVELSPSENGFWYGDNTLHEPRVVFGALEGVFVWGQGLLAEADYQRLFRDTSPSRFGYEWRMEVDYGKVDSSNIDSIAADVGALTLEYDASTGPGSVHLSTSIDDIAEDQTIQQLAAVSLSSVILVGLAGLVVATGVVLAALAARRRQDVSILIRSRGAPGLRLSLGRFAEGVLLFAPIGALGLLAAETFIDGRSADRAWVHAILVSVVFALLLVALSMPVFAGHLGRLLTGSGTRIHPARRLVVEATLVLAGVGSVVLVSRRGLDTSESGFDLLLSATPLLAGLAAGVILLRFAPFVARVASAAGSRARGLVGLIGFRSVAGRPVTGQLPAVVILVAVSLAVVGSVVTATVEDTQVRGSYHEVGANYRVQSLGLGAKLSPEIDLSRIEGIEATAFAAEFDAQVDDEGFLRSGYQFLAVDVTDYQEVLRGTPADPGFPRTMMEPLPEEDIGTESNPIPALISSTWQGPRPRVGEVVRLLVELRHMVIVIDAVRDEFPGLEPDSPFIVVDRLSLAGANARLDTDPDRNYVAAPDSVSDQLVADVQSQPRAARVISRPDVLASITEDPMVESVSTTHLIAIAASAVFAAMAAVAGMALTSSERTRDMGYLRAVGLTQRQMIWVTVTEQIPLAVVSALVGIGLGVGLAMVVIPVFDLVSLTGTEIDVETIINWGPIAAIGIAVLGTVVGATAIYGYINRRLDLASVLRRGDRT